MSLSFLTPKYTEVEINGENVNFYPVSISVAFQIKEAIKPIARALGNLMADSSSDRGYTSSRNAEGFEQTVVDPMSVELARFRNEKREQAILDIVDSITERKSRTALGRLIMNSMRDEFPNQKLEQADVDNFLDAVDTDTMVQLVKGVLKANARVFGPFGEKIAEMFKIMNNGLRESETTENQENKMTESSLSEKSSGTDSAEASIFSSLEDTPTEN